MGTYCGRVTLRSCKINVGVFRQKEYQQFRLKKAGRCREKTLSGYKRRESRVQRHAAVTLPSRPVVQRLKKQNIYYIIKLSKVNQKSLYFACLQEMLIYLNRRKSEESSFTVGSLNILNQTSRSTVQLFLK